MAVLCLVICAHAQVNIKIGYHVAIPNLEKSDQILAAFQPTDAQVEQPFGNLKFLHGIQLGLRYKWENMAVEAGWENVSRDRTALIYRPSTDSFSDRQYNYGLGGYYFGLDSYFSNFGIGSLLSFQNLDISRVIGNNDLKIVDESAMAVRLQLIWRIQESSLVSVMLKPFYQFNLSTYHLGPLVEDVGAVINDVEESPKIFGVSLVFYNGKQ